MATPMFRSRHLALLIALLLIIIATPILAPLRHGLLVVNLIGAIVLIAGSYSISDRKHFLAVAIVFSATSLIGNWFMVMYPGHVAVVVAHSVTILLLSFFAITTLAYVVRSGEVTANKIYAAICAYLLIGYAWALGYSVLEECQPGSFGAPAEIAPGDYVNRVIEMRYFSFITLATVGYGDIVPRSSTARTMAILEAIVGQFYLVALIGRLVGLHIVHGNPEREKS